MADITIDQASLLEEITGSEKIPVGNGSGNPATVSINQILEKIPQPDLSKYALKDELPSDYLTVIPDEYITEQELNSKGYITEHQDLSEYALKSDIPTDYITEIPEEYITEQKLEQQLSNKQNSVQMIDHGTGDTTFVLPPNEFHKWGTVESLSIELGEITNSNIYNEYMFEFVSGTTATTLTLPASIKWLSEPQITTDTTYQCSIVNNIGLIIGV